MLTSSPVLFVSSFVEQLSDAAKNETKFAIRRFFYNKCASSTFHMSLVQFGILIAKVVINETSIPSYGNFNTELAISVTSRHFGFLRNFLVNLSTSF